MYNQIKDIVTNNNSLESAEEVLCESCFDPLLFHIKDSKGNESVLGLITVLEMVEIAIKEGYLPKLPRSWCYQFKSYLGIEFDDDSTVYDYDNFVKKE